MNELQIRLTADIKDLQSALAKAKQTLKSFETETSTDSEKSNVGFRRKVGLIEQLNAKAKQLKVSLSQATNEKQIAAFNAQLEETNIELTRLNALGKSFSAPAVRSFDNLKRSAGAASGAAISFGRIIQDAPFGIIGVANNIQNFGEQFSALGGKAASAGQKLSMFFSALITPANLAILAVSALTAAYQAYSLGLFDADEQTKDLRTESEKLSDSLESVTKNLNAVDSARLQSNKGAADELVELELLNSVLNDTSKSEYERLRAYNLLIEKYPRVLGNITQEKALVDGLGDSYITLVNAIGQKAAAIAIEDKLVELAKQRLDIVQKEKNEVLLDLQLRKQKANLQNQEAAALKELTKLQEEGAEQAKIFTATAKWIEYGQQIDKVDEELRNLGNTQMVTTTNALIKNAASVEFLKNEYLGLGQTLIGLLDPVDSVKESAEGLNRVFDEQISLAQRFGNLTDNNKKKVDGLSESLAKEQKALFETVATLKQEPATLINIEQLAIAQQRLSEIDGLIGSIASKREQSPEIKVDENQLIGLELPGKQQPGIIEKLEKEIALYESLKTVTSDPGQLEKYKLKLSELRNELASVDGEEVKDNLEILGDAFASLGAGIVASLNISNSALRGFVSTLISATPKIIAALSAQANSNLDNAGKNIAADKAESISSGIKQGTKFAEALGPVGLALLPVFIAGAVAVISSAFNKTSSGGSVSAGSGSTYTNRREFGGPVSKGRAYIVGERRPELFVPNTNGIIVPQLPSMDYSGASMAAGAMAVDVNIRGVSYGDDILFTVQQAQIRRGIR